MEPTPTYAACEACGTSPVNHQLAYGVNVLDELIGGFVRTLAAVSPLPPESALTRFIDPYVYPLLTMLGIARFNADPSKALNERSELIWHEALTRGMPMEQVVLLGRHLDQYRALVNGEWMYFQSLPIPYWLPQEGYAWVDDKFVLAERLRARGVPAPRAFAVSSWNQAQKAFNELTKPVIIKPKIGSRGRHTTTHITTPEELRAAYDLARQIARELVVEEHLFGSVYRATVINGRLVGFFRADPPRVTGDGVHTIQELIHIQNAARPERIGEIRITADTKSFVARKGFTLESMLPEGIVLDLTAKTGRFFGGYTREMLSEIHPQFNDIFAKAGAVVEIPIAGFDVIIPDPIQSPDSQTWGIIECNSLPFIDLHYFALEGPRNNLAPLIWDLWQKPA